MDVSFSRAWCEGMARGREVQHIDRNGAPYLHRYFLAGWSPRTAGPTRPSIFLHHFLASDPADQVHSHPWGWSSSLILVGGYREHRCLGHRYAPMPGDVLQVKEYRPGDVNVLMPDDKHRIELLDADCWTLFLAGNYAQPWTFTDDC